MPKRKWFAGVQPGKPPKGTLPPQKPLFPDTLSLPTAIPEGGFGKTRHNTNKEKIKTPTLPQTLSKTITTCPSPRGLHRKGKTFNMKAQKKIAILSPAHPLRGGIAASTERLAQEWQQRGAEVTIYSFSLQYPALLFPGKSQYTEDPPPTGLNILPVLNSINPLSWWKTARTIAREKPDILLVRYWLPFLAPALGSVCRKVKKKQQTRIICIADNIIPHEHRPGDKLLTRYFLRAIDAFIVMSKSVGEELKSFRPQAPQSYVPHPVYDHYGKKVSKKEAIRSLMPSGKSFDESTHYILFFGFIREYKGLDLLIHAMADARLRQMPVKLLVAGEFYGNEKKYYDLVNKLQLNEKIIFHNEYIPREKVRYYFGLADIVAQPYRTATQSGITQLAYHFEKPMLVTRVGGLPEIVPHGKAGYVTDVSPPAIAEALSDFFQNNRKTSMEQFVQKHKQHFSWSRLAEEIERLAFNKPVTQKENQQKNK